MTDLSRSSVHFYTVEFRISGKNLDPEEVTRALDLQPCQTRLVGEQRGTGKTWAESLWAFRGSTNSNFSNEWSSLEEGICFVVRELRSRQSIIKKFAEVYDVFWWCGHFQSSFDGGPFFSVSLLRELADFGIPLYLDNYRFEAED